MALHGNADAAFRISVTQTGQIAVECKKQKDAPASPMMLFTRREVLLQIGNVEDRSFVLDLASEGEDAMKIAKPKVEAKLKGALQKVYDVLKRLSDKNPEKDSVFHITKTDWRTECLKLRLYKRSDYYNRAFVQLVLYNLVRYDDATKTYYLTDL